ncbi:MAG: amylo-alpha-1,6-glucosidase [Candidatus Krumholzibacteria bacterium]|nr:amylo-alpha-1,6-glucosidase [Candidatus Krumholzibacteria bacterium]
MARGHDAPVAAARAAAIEVLLHNARRTRTGLPRTAAWGYPEPYTRDLMLSSLGFLTSGQPELAVALRRTLSAAARNQTPHGLIPGLADDPADLGSSDTTPLFLVALALYRRHAGERRFLAAAARKALTWLAYQSPDDRAMVAQEPTSDWRDEQWVEGYGLFVNALVVMALELHGRRARARTLRELMNRLTVTAGHKHAHVHEGLRQARKPYYALWTLKVHGSERFDLVGNSLAIIAGIPPRARARAMISWIEAECAHLRASGRLALDLPPVLFPFIERDHPDWRARYETHNRPGEYHNGGVWPFACALYVAAQVAAGRARLARRTLAALTRLVAPARDHDVAFGFNEWFRAQDGAPCGHDWQTWSAALYLYAASCVEQGRTPLLEGLRRHWRA